MSAETIIGSYLIGERIGRGGMGEVFRGRHTKLPREVAIKSISPRARAQDLRHLRHRFEREAFIQSQLDHPGIVKIYDYIVAEQTYYIVMEYVEGRSLAQLLAQEVKPLPVERALYLFDQILVAVSYAHTFTYKDQDGNSHRGIIHRDFKPANLMVTPQDRIKITDFGIVKLVGADTTDTFGTGYGSPRYVSPEQAQGLAVDQRSDLYSLGIILYEMLTGSPPFGNSEDKLTRTEILRAHVEREPRAPSKINSEISPEVESIILHALEKDPADRFQTAAEFLRSVRLARARDAGDVIDEAQATIATHVFRPVGTHELDDAEAGSDHTVRQSYVTQPIRGSACLACGAEAEGGETNCRVCGARLGSSPSTANLTRREAAGRASARGKLAVVALVAIGIVTGTLIYLNLSRQMRQRAAEERAQNANAQSQSAANANGPIAQASAPPPASLVELKPARVLVDSSFDGYNDKPLTDGVTDVRRISAMRYNEGNWASAETPGDHWIELRFDRPTSVAAVYVYWGFDKNRYLAARRAELQTSDGDDSWRTISTVEPGDNYDRTSFDFAPVKTTRLRVLQPAQQGPPNRSFIMWVREVQVFGEKDQK